ncbi:MAG: ABC transporter substrate-binding protein [Pseudomonadota bacterium]
MKRAVWLIGAAVLASCNPRPDTGPVVVSVIGTQPSFDGQPARDEPTRVLAAAVAEGLVRFDGAGQIEPGLAERWIVIDGGLRYIFRLRPSQWSDGRPVTAAQVVTILKRRLRDSGSVLAPYLTAIDELVEMTPQVIEVRLSRPRPDLLKLFAQPEFAIQRQRPPGGGGPFRIVAGAGPGLLLRPAIDPSRAADDDEAREPQPEEDVRLIGERAARAVARFARRDSDLVLSGTFADWPVAAVAGIAPANIRVDPAAGLFGLAVTRREGLLADAADRAAIASAFDRAAIAASFAPGGVAAEALLPDRLDSAAPAVQPAWALTTLAARRRVARARVADWIARTGEAARLGIALPDGPGTRPLFKRLSNSLAAIGVEAVRLRAGDRSSDLRLIDAVAPYDSARWYLATACAPCGEEATAAVEAARLAPTLRERARAIALADTALAADTAFIPLTRPLRWSLVALRLRQFQGNPRGWHPLNHLRTERN